MDVHTLASRYDFSGGQIENIVRKRFIDEVLTGVKTDIHSLQAICRNELLDNKTIRHIGFTHRAS